MPLLKNISLTVEVESLSLLVIKISKFLNLYRDQVYLTSDVLSGSSKLPISNLLSNHNHYRFTRDGDQLTVSIDSDHAVSIRNTLIVISKSVSTYELEGKSIDVILDRLDLEYITIPSDNFDISSAWVSFGNMLHTTSI